MQWKSEPERAEAQLTAAGYRIQQLLDQIKTRGETPDANISLPLVMGRIRRLVRPESRRSGAALASLPVEK